MGYAEHYSGIKGNYTIKNCVNYGVITCSYQQVGGIIAYIDSGKIENCTNNGKVVSVAKNNTKNTAGMYAAGIAGILADGATISNCKNTGEIIADLGDVGGIAGRIVSGTTISNCENTGTIKQLNKYNFTDGSKYAVGGICGRNQGTVEYSYNTGVVESNTTVGNTEYAGGIVGRNLGTLQNCYNSGVVKNSNYIGGVVGYLEKGTLTKNYYYVDNITKGIGTSTAEPNGNDIVGQAEIIDAAEARTISNFTQFKSWIETK